MIASYGNKMTPKHMAQFMLAYFLETAKKTIELDERKSYMAYGGPFQDEIEDMTDREREKVADQLVKIIERAADAAGIEDLYLG